MSSDILLKTCFPLASGGGDTSPMSEGTPTYEPQHLPPWESGGVPGGGGGVILPGQRDNSVGPGHAAGEAGAAAAGNRHSPRSGIITWCITPL